MKLPIALRRTRSSRFFVALALIGVCWFPAETVTGANVLWNAPGNISGINDVSTVGSLIEAANTGSDSNGVGTTTTVNGVTFIGFPVNGGGTIASPGGHFGLTAAAGYFHSSFNGFGSGSSPFSSLAASYQTLLGWGNFTVNSSNPNDFTGALTLTISGLMIGQQYLFQWWTNDSRPFATGPVIATSGVTTVGLSPNTTNSPGGVGQFAIGTFTADATTQLIVFSAGGNATLISGFQLRAIPEPSTMPLVLTGMACAIIARRVRRKV